VNGPPLDLPRHGPNALLVRVASALAPGDALDAGMGEGRNALWLAARGWRVTGFDPDARAVNEAQRRVREAGLQIDTHVLRAGAFDWGVGRFDLVLFCYGGRPRRAASMASAALRPGGVVIVEAFHRDAAEERRIGERVVFDTGELRRLYEGLDVLVDDTPRDTPDFGAGTLRLVRFVGRKPGVPRPPFGR
jgi:SAM-dependent methyltransferase